MQSTLQRVRRMAVGAERAEPVDDELSFSEGHLARIPPLVCRGRLLDGGQRRLRALVRVVEPGLPARQVGVVDVQEQQQALDVRLAKGQLERLAVVRRLRLLVLLRRRRLAAVGERFASRARRLDISP